MASNFFRTAFKKAGGGAYVRRDITGLAMWSVPAAVGGAWFIWPALDQEWLIELGLAKEPDLHIKAVQAAKEARMAAKQKAKPAAPKEEEEEEEEEEEPAAEEEAADEGGEEESGGDEEEGGDDDDEEEEESSIPKFEPLVAKSDGTSLEAAWDNFTIKSIRPGEDDDDDDEDDDDDDDDE